MKVCKLMITQSFEMYYKYLMLQYIWTLRTKEKNEKNVVLMWFYQIVFTK